jgi:hypothetical protein
MFSYDSQAARYLPSPSAGSGDSDHVADLLDTRVVDQSVISTFGRNARNTRCRTRQITLCRPYPSLPYVQLQRCSLGLSIFLPGTA